ncbi:MAG: hypothetical protein A4E55_02375 [Pelotomaculum sp. PtaU1.Bin035]|nr:MAG: hypothetical protein A4E55_02375 [Pelotomaculum sp. PtaU1.Bin035]
MENMDFNVRFEIETPDYDAPLLENMFLSFPGLTLKELKARQHSLSKLLPDDWKIGDTYEDGGKAIMHCYKEEYPIPVYTTKQLIDTMKTIKAEIESSIAAFVKCDITFHLQTINHN